MPLMRIKNASIIVLNGKNALLGRKKGGFHISSMFGVKSPQRPSATNTKTDDHSSSTQAPIEESSEDSLSEELDPQSMLESYTRLLSTDNVQENIAGLKKLMESYNPLDKNQHTSHDEDVIAKSIVYGGSIDSVEERLQDCLTRFLFGDDEDDDDDEYSAFSDDRDDTEAYNMESSRRILTNNDAELHLLTLQLVIHSLERILSSDTTYVEVDPIDFKTNFWRHTVAALIRNLETIPTVNITGHSLKCLRLLHTLEPILVKQMLQQSLMPYIIYLKEYGETRRLPMIESEASRLMKRADIQATKYITI